jgi:hypothetical protein
VRQAAATQGAKQHVGHGREPHAKLVGAHRGARGAVGEQIKLALLDTVAAAAVQMGNGTSTARR